MRLQSRADLARIRPEALEFAGGPGNDMETGSVGNDTMNGGAGNDTLVGIGGDDLLIGGIHNDELRGGDGNDTLDGGAHNDRLFGGDGDDSYIVDSYADLVAEDADAGIDTVTVLFFQQFTLSANVENGETVATLIGNMLDNRLSVIERPNSGNGYLEGAGGADTLIGGSANDYLIGGEGADSMIGGAGNDTYVYDPLDTVVELVDGGSDTIVIAADVDLNSFPIANIEGITLSAGDFDVVGDSNANMLTGSSGHNTLVGAAGNDTLSGHAGDDRLEGGEGDDTISGDLGEDHPLLFGNDTLLGGAGNDRIRGDFGADLIDGGDGDDYLAGDGAYRVSGFGSDDTLIAGAGFDTLDGAGGNDTYYVSTGDIIIEYFARGLDRVFADSSYELSLDIEILTLTGSGDFNGAGNDIANAIFGNSGANVLDGREGADSLNGLDGNDTLIGGSGADTLTGGAGADTLQGGVGNDVYRVEGMGDTVVELDNQGFDRVISDGSFSLATLLNVERLELVGNIPGFLRGNANANTLIGNAGSNTIEGYDGNDTILGLGGRDTIIGGLGRDTIAPGLERDTVRWNSVAESTGVNRDVVSEFVFTSGGPYELLDFHVLPTALRQTITTGTLREGSFDADLQLAVNPNNLGAGQAVLFDPSDGDLNVAGHLYLIVDANGVAGYQAGQDYVVQFTSTYGTLTLANFI